MNTTEIIYTDGHDVIVTPSMLQTKHASYKLNGVTKHGMAILKADRLPGILVMSVGIVLMLISYFQVLPADAVQSASLFGYSLKTAVVAFYGGILVTTLGLLATIFNRERYAVRIATAEGERDIVSSTHREYITQILNAINRALMIREGYGEYGKTSRVRAS